ncbi:MAG TPA: YsnF/AvaK domain-containing protein [Solirubrobacteraceae bacterium]|nr:YsnF/AvaK domain-containing protein [Solirubrobacteraceae bacterium]
MVEIYEDRGTGQPSWLAVKTGLFGSNVSFVPLQQATRGDDGIRVAYDKDLVKDAPNVPADSEISAEEERRLYEHYSLDFGDFDYDRDYDTGTVGHDTSGPTTDQAMTRSEEELRVGTAPVETGRARLRKYVTTEQVQTTVPVQREEVGIEREPITDANVGAATDAPAISEEEHEVTLHAEEPVVEKRVVPKERVRLDKANRHWPSRFSR